jgi:hypothetical protein
MGVADAGMEVEDECNGKGEPGGRTTTGTDIKTTITAENLSGISKAINHQSEGLTPQSL